MVNTGPELCTEERYRTFQRYLRGEIKLSDMHENDQRIMNRMHDEISFRGNEGIIIYKSLPWLPRERVWDYARIKAEGYTGGVKKLHEALQQEIRVTRDICNKVLQEQKDLGDNTVSARNAPSMLDGECAETPKETPALSAPPTTITTSHESSDNTVQHEVQLMAYQPPPQIYQGLSADLETININELVPASDRQNAGHQQATVSTTFQSHSCDGMQANMGPYIGMSTTVDTNPAVTFSVNDVTRATTSASGNPSANINTCLSTKDGMSQYEEQIKQDEDIGPELDYITGTDEDLNVMNLDYGSFNQTSQGLPDGLQSITVTDLVQHWGYQSPVSETKLETFHGLQDMDALFQPMIHDPAFQRQASQGLAEGQKLIQVMDVPMIHDPIPQTAFQTQASQGLADDQKLFQVMDQVNIPQTLAHQTPPKTLDAQTYRGLTTDFKNIQPMYPVQDTVPQPMAHQSTLPSVSKPQTHIGLLDDDMTIQGMDVDLEVCGRADTSVMDDIIDEVINDKNSDKQMAEDGDQWSQSATVPTSLCFNTSLAQGSHSLDTTWVFSEGTYWEPMM